MWSYFLISLIPISLIPRDVIVRMMENPKIPHGKVKTKQKVYLMRGNARFPAIIKDDTEAIRVRIDGVRLRDTARDYHEEREMLNCWTRVEVARNNDDCPKRWRREEQPLLARRCPLEEMLGRVGVVAFAFGSRRTICWLDVTGSIGAHQARGARAGGTFPAHA